MRSFYGLRSRSKSPTPPPRPPVEPPASAGRVLELLAEAGQDEAPFLSWLWRQDGRPVVWPPPERVAVRWIARYAETQVNHVG
jgi:hypothetical protein